MIMEPITKQVEESLGRLEKSFHGSPQVRKFENSIKDFDRLVERGVVKRRGNHLLSPADLPIDNHVVNTPHNKSINPTRENVRFSEVDSCPSNARNW